MLIIFIKKHLEWIRIEEMCEKRAYMQYVKVEQLQSNILQG